MLQRLSGKSILVLGGSGFVGKSVISLAIKNGAKVTGLSRNRPK